MVVPAGAGRSPPGETVVAEIDFTLDLPDNWGRWGHHNGDHVPAQLVPGAGPPRRPRLGADAVRPLAPALAPGGGPLHGAVRPARRPGRRLVGPDHVGARGRARAGSGVDDRGEPRARLRAASARTGSRPASGRPARRSSGSTRFPEHAGNAERDPRLRLRGHPALRAVVRPVLRRRVRDRPVVLRLERQRVLGPGPARRPGDAAPLGRGSGTSTTWSPTRRCHQWFWNVVGTDGYAETFMDEGLVNCFTALRLDAKYGRNAPADRLAEGPDLAADDRPRGPPAVRLLRLAGTRQRRRR